VGGKLIPHEVRAIKDGKVIAIVKVLEAAEVNDVKMSLFDPPADSILWPQCDNMQDAELIEGACVDFPATARAAGARGRVIVHGVIEVDGSLSQAAAIQDSNPDINTAVLQAYSPLALQTSPVWRKTSPRRNVLLRLLVPALTTTRAEMRRGVGGTCKVHFKAPAPESSRCKGKMAA
jgi:hypothetical protein